MRRLKYLFIVFLCASSCYAQLSKFDGTWIYKNILYGEQNLPLYQIFKISVDKDQVYIRVKDTYKDLDGNEKGSYYKIRDIRIDGDSLISCNAFFPPGTSSRFWYSPETNPYTPNNHLQFDICVEYEIYEMSIQGGVLIVKVPYLVQEFSMNDTVVDRNMIIRGYDFDCYNEKDNW